MSVCLCEYYYSCVIPKNVYKIKSFYAYLPGLHLLAFKDHHAFFAVFFAFYIKLFHVP